MRGLTGFGVVGVVGVLAIAACRETVVIDQRAGDGGGGFDGSAINCTGAPTEFFAPPEVIVALDRSTGMGSALGVARDALELYAARYQKVVRFGYVDFPGAGELCTPQCGACPGVITPPPPLPELGGFLDALHACEQPPYGCMESILRPTNAALTSCAYVFSRRDRNRRYVLLITNGRPDCGTGPSSGCAEVQTTIYELASNAVTTHVVAPGQFDPSTGQCLQDFAIANGTYHPTQTLAELTDELGSLMRSFAEDACDLEPTMRVPAPDAPAVYWRDMAIPQRRNGVDGWELMGNGDVRLNGQWCNLLIENGPADFKLFPDCDPPH